MFDALSSEEWRAVTLSLRVSAVATLLSLPLGIFVAYALARWQFRGRQLLNGLVHLPLILPPVVTGYLLLVAFGRNGILGAPLPQPVLLGPSPLQDPSAGRTQTLLSPRPAPLAPQYGR